MDTAFSFLKGPDRVDEHDKFVRYQNNTPHVHPIEESFQKMDILFAQIIAWVLQYCF